MASVQSIERAFTILDAVSSEPRGVTEIAGKADLPKSTVARLLSTLEQLGAVERAEGGVEYRLGPRLQELVGPADPTARLVDRVHPSLEWLSLQLGEGTGFAIPSGSAIQVVSQVEGPHPVQVRNYSGDLFPAHVGAPGVVLMAQWGESELDRYLAHPLNANTEHTVVQPHQIRDRIAQVRREGVCWAHEEFAEGISTVAAAVHGSSGRVLGALYGHGPTYRFPAPDNVQWTADLIYRTAGEIFAPGTP